MRFVQETVGVSLDYRSDTLPVLDHYLKQAARDAREEIRELLAPAAGAYFGEVVRRAFETVRWHAPSDDYPDYRLEFESFFLCFNPIGAAMEVLLGREQPGWGGHFHMLDDARDTVRDALARSPELNPEDYYTLSVRFEVVEQVADILATLEGMQKTPRHFGPEVYRVANGGSTDRGEPS